MGPQTEGYSSSDSKTVTENFASSSQTQSLRNAADFLTPATFVQTAMCTAVIARAAVEVGQRYASKEPSRLSSLSLSSKFQRWGEFIGGNPKRIVDPNFVNVNVGPNSISKEKGSAAAGLNLNLMSLLRPSGSDDDELRDNDFDLMEESPGGVMQGVATPQGLEPGTRAGEVVNSDANSDNFWSGLPAFNLQNLFTGSSSSSGPGSDYHSEFQSSDSAQGISKETVLSSDSGRKYTGEDGEDEGQSEG